MNTRNNYSYTLVYTKIPTKMTLVKATMANKALKAKLLKKRYWLNMCRM